MESDHVSSTPSKKGEDNEGSSLTYDAYEQTPSTGEISSLHIYRQRVYREDVVKNDSGLIGVVVEISGDSDSESCSSDDDNDGDDDEMDHSNEDSGGMIITDDHHDGKKQSLPFGHIRVLWIDDSETIESHENVTVCDRGFLHGDSVAAASDPTGQVGVVVDISLSVDLQTSGGETVSNVPSKVLRRVREFTIGDYVICGVWLGRVDDVIDNVSVCFSDGSACRVARADPAKLKPVVRNLIEDLNFPFYPGQRVRAGSASLLKNARWVSGSWKSGRLEGAVADVTVASVFVYWIACAGHAGGGGGSYVSPPREQSPRNLKLLSHLTYANWQLGDRCLLSDQPPEGDHRDPRPGSTNHAAHRKKIRRVAVRREKKLKKRTEKPEESPALRVVGIGTGVDVVWQDGTVERGVESNLLVPIENPADHEYTPERYVVEKAADDGVGVGGERRVGVVVSSSAKQRTARVRWCVPVSRPEDPRVFGDEDVASVYELEPHPDYDYCHGDVVVRLSPPADSGGSDSWVGTITGLRDGDIEVTWADGVVSTVGPQAVYVVGRSDGESVDDGSDDDDITDDAASWETVEDDEEALIVDEVEGGASFSQTAFGFFAKLASGIFSRGAKRDEMDVSDDVDESSAGISSISEPESSDRRRLSFKGFDIVEDPSDHFYYTAGAVGNVAEKKWVRKVQQDWGILQNNLPEEIYVRVYEERMDLMRAAIVGACGTPYQDGLFFFDIQLPTEYPSVPPTAHYYSGGWRINPNLYEDGKVCLSLLNTWTGRGNEVWDPSSSSILQVLVSLQGLVLNAKPYFNEAGYDRQVGTAEGEKNSVAYNENTFLLNCKMMMHIIRRPPRDFEDFVTEHFRTRGSFVLGACDAYMKGHLIGSLADDASAVAAVTSDYTSVGFKIMLAKIAPKLLSFLRDLGVDCRSFEHLLHSESESK